MEDRSFEPVKVGLFGVETGKSRFYQNQEDRIPPFAYWRVNLTALSQRHNLYFFASRHRIQVYKPEFPFQTLRHRPALTILPQLNNPNARGYIDEDWPHNINHLIVGDLGNQEILLLSTDSGNIVAYYTSAISKAAEDDPYRFSNDGNADFVGLRPFFSEWVHESAWGLAIHSEGRMVAVSANTPRRVENSDPCSKITVFAFALSSPLTGVTNENKKGPTSTFIDHSEWTLWSPLSPNNCPIAPPRDCNYKIVLAGPGGHKSNIPSISFLNVPEDRHGSWLLSTDIVGRMKLWQIWKGRCLKSWDFGDENTAWLPHEEAGWLVAAFDPRAFRPAEDTEKLIGFSSARRYHGYHQPGDSYDLSGQVQEHLPQNSKFHPCARLFDDSSEDEEKDIIYQSTVDSEDEEALSTQRETRSVRIATSISNANPLQHSSRSRWSATQEEAGLATEANTDGDRNDFANPPGDSEEDDQDDDDDDDDGASEEMEIEITGVLSDEGESEGEDRDDSIDVNEDEEDDDDDEEEEDNDPSPSSQRSATTISSYDEEDDAASDVPYDENDELVSGSVAVAATRKRAKRSKTGGRADVPLVPMLQCSTSHVRLFSSPTAHDPHIFYAKMLKQQLPARMEHTNFSVLDRLNMLHQIPELGIVLIASQLGRCAVCSLTRREKDGFFGLRVDWILPTKKQERDGARPAHHVLLGIAASPIQGRARDNQKSVSEDEGEDDWAQDRVIHGVPTTFDPHVVSLRSALHQTTVSSDSDEESDVLIDIEKAPAQRTAPSFVPMERRKWRKPHQIEEFRGSDNSRTYRLILTYSDMTVLSYELSRDIEKEDRA